MSEFTCPAVCLPTPVYLGTLLGDQHITDKHLTALQNSLAHVCWSTCDFNKIFLNQFSSLKNFIKTANSLNNCTKSKATKCYSDVGFFQNNRIIQNHHLHSLVAALLYLCYDSCKTVQNSVYCMLCVNFTSSSHLCLLFVIY